MNVNRVLDLRGGEAAPALQNFLEKLWRVGKIDAMLLPVELPDGSGILTQTVTGAHELSAVNPFAPVMLSNTAAAVAAFIQEQPRGRLAVMLRPCELRALVELHKRRRTLWQTPDPGSNGESLLIIGVDCPGTLPQLEYARRVSAQGVQAVIRQALAYGFEDSLGLRQLRTACQICDSPSAHGADIILGTIGLESRQELLVIARDEFIDQEYHLEAATDRIALEMEVVLREVAVGKVTDERAARRENLCTANGSQYGDFCNLLACFTRCTMCADCLDACPLYEGELMGMLGVSHGQRQGRPLLPELVAVGRWLASCSGCGMCQDACENGVPLTLLVSALSHKIQKELHYASGEPAQSLPWRAPHRARTQHKQEEGLHVISG